MSTIISWTDYTWNPVTGCSRISEGCRHCYAEALSLKRGWSKLPWTERNAAENVICHPDRLRMPYRFKPGSRVFTNSMSDMWHDMVPDAFLRDMFRVMNETPQITYQILTKRPERCAAWPGPWTPNIWMGTSIEDRLALKRLDALRRCGAAVKFISAEPLLESLVPIGLTGVDWVIAGGESGPGFRPMEMGWARELRDLCAERQIAFFLKQDAAYRTETRCYLVEEDGRCFQYRQFPDALVPPVEVPPDNPKRHREVFQVLA